MSFIRLKEGRPISPALLKFSHLLNLAKLYNTWDHMVKFSIPIIPMGIVYLGFYHTHSEWHEILNYFKLQTLHNLRYYYINNFLGHLPFGHHLFTCIFLWHPKFTLIFL